MVKNNRRKDNILENCHIETINNPINRTKFYPLDRKKFRDKLNIKEDDAVILLGSDDLNDPKGIKLAFDAVLKLVNKGLNI